MKHSTAITLSCPQKKATTCTVEALNSEIVSNINHFSAEEWDAQTANHQSFLRHNYLKAIANHQSQNEYFYVLFSNELGPVGCAAFQIVLVKDGMRFPPAQNFGDRLLNSVKSYFNTQTFKMLVCGNALVTGDYGFHFDYSVPKKVQIASLVKTINTINAQTKVDMAMLKDFKVAQGAPEEEDLKAVFGNLGYNHLRAQPNMFLPIRPHWENFDTYLADMTSKARTRVKKNLKKGKSIFRKDLTLAEVEAENETIYNYYRKVADRVEFNLLTAGADYFIQCKQEMGDNFRVLGYYLEDRLVGFITLVLSPTEIESHFIGFDESLNHEHALYPNILLDQIRFAIEESNVQKISFGRTALEIKSSFGAEPQELISVGWAKNPLYHRFIPRMFANLADSIEWTQRKPFKDSTKK